LPDSVDRPDLTDGVHISGGQGVAGSNPVVPTVYPCRSEGWSGILGSALAAVVDHPVKGVNLGWRSLKQGGNAW